MTVAELIEVLKTMPEGATVVAYSCESDMAEVGPCGVEPVSTGDSDDITIALFPVRYGTKTRADYVLINGWPYNERGSRGRSHLRGHYGLCGALARR